MNDSRDLLTDCLGDPDAIEFDERLLRELSNVEHIYRQNAQVRTAQAHGLRIVEVIYFVPHHNPRVKPKFMTRTRVYTMNALYLLEASTDYANLGGCIYSYELDNRACKSFPTVLARKDELPRQLENLRRSQLLWDMGGV
ncbi:MAG: hypothetical protein AB7L09_01670 [Nitrospira sp.]